MKASEAKVGERYLSRTGVMVVCEGTERDRVILRMQPSGTIFLVTPGYELKPINPDGKILKRKAAKAVAAPKQQSGVGATTVKPPRAASLAAIIDPMLLSSGYTVKEIAAEVARKAGEAAKGKDIEANVRARMMTYKRKGWQVAKDENKRVRILRNTACANA